MTSVIVGVDPIGIVRALKVDEQGRALVDPKIVEYLEEIRAFLRPTEGSPVNFMFGPNGMVAAFDEKGQQVPQWQGTREEIVRALLRRSFGHDVGLEVIGGGL